jgi:DNA-binding CsgD family transcriptional regulator/tetratricopeptide (TPR) repeat protein
MQPTRLDVNSDVFTPSPLALALEAYLRGDVDACLALLAGATELCAAEQREALLLRVRVLLRQFRFSEAIEMLGPALDSFSAVDEACSARMLHGIAVARSGQLQRGLSLLLDLHAAARALHPHPTVRAEIAYWVAFAYWLQRNYRATLEYAVLAEAAKADVISVRAATLRGYVAATKEHYTESLALFRSARRAYHSCRERDADLRDRIESQIAILEVSIRSKHVSGSHTLPGERLPEETPRNVPSILRLQEAAMDAWLFAFDGDRRNAYHRVRVCEDLATNQSWRLWALANRAQLAAAFGDLDIADTFATQGLEIVDRVDWNTTTNEERVGLLLLAEALATTSPLSAATVLRRYDELTSQIDRSLLFHDDVRLWILETFVRGLVHRIGGNVTEAWKAFKNVYRTAQRVGIVWRAALALIELDATPIAARPRGEHYLQTAALLIRENFPRSFLSRRLGRWMSAHRDPIAAALAPQPREVMRHVLAGRNAKEIATAMSLSEDTVKGYLKTLFRAFSVHSMPELLVACYERGIGSPSWWSTLDNPNPPLIPGERSATRPKRLAQRKGVQRT